MVGSYWSTWDVPAENKSTNKTGSEPIILTHKAFVYISDFSSTIIENPKQKF